MIVDSSAVLAILFAENHAERTAKLMQSNAGSLAISVVNVAECEMRIRSQVTPAKLAATLATFHAMPFTWINADSAQAQLAAEVRLKYSALNFGDCFAYALAKLRNEPLLTLDADFLVTDLEIVGVTEKGDSVRETLNRIYGAEKSRLDETETQAQADILESEGW